jgi:cysteine desulfuration protein SufE
MHQQQIIDTLNSLPDWQARFNHIIELGQTLPQMPEHLMTPENRIGACTSRTFFKCLIDNNKITVHGWSNAAIPAGLIAILKTVCDQMTVHEMRSYTIDFHHKTELFDNLSLTRRAALSEMLFKIAATVISAPPNS